jgi:hypothetical protein
MRFALLDLLNAFWASLSRQKDVEIDDEPSAVEKLPAAAATIVEVPVNEAETVVQPTPQPSGRQWHDLRGEPRSKSRGRSKGTRDWSKIRGITIHQTAVDFGTNPHRLINVPVHGATLRDGSIVLLHDPPAYMWHGHSFNKHDIGIEVSCRAAGIKGNGASLWLPKEVRRGGTRVKSKTLSPDERLEHASEATDDQLEATRVLIQYYVDQVEKHGGKIEFIHAHRQSSKSRVSDPGSRIWKACGVWAIEKLGLSAGPPGWSAGGYPLPDAWTGEANGVRYNSRIDGRIDGDEKPDA